MIDVKSRAGRKVGSTLNTVRTNRVRGWKLPRAGVNSRGFLLR